LTKEKAGALTPSPSQGEGWGGVVMSNRETKKMFVSGSNVVPKAEGNHVKQAKAGGGGNFCRLAPVKSNRADGSKPRQPCRNKQNHEQCTEHETIGSDFKNHQRLVLEGVYGSFRRLVLDSFSGVHAAFVFLRNDAVARCVKKQQNLWVNWDNKGQSIIQDVMILVSFALCILWWIFAVTPVIDWWKTRTPSIKIVGRPVVEASKVTFNCEFNRIPEEDKTKYLLVDYAVPEGQEPRRYELTAPQTINPQKASDRKQFVVNQKFDSEQHRFAIQAVNGDLEATSKPINVVTNDPPEEVRFYGAMIGIKMPVNEENPQWVILKFGWHPPSANVNKVHIYR
jgi:hypothetical protein